MKRISFIALLIAAAAPLCVPLPAQVSAMAAIPASPDLLAAKAKDTVNINLDSSMLHLATGFLSKNDQADNPGLKKLIAGLKNISVRKYSFAEEGQYKPEDVQPVRDQLRAAGWGTFLGFHGDKGGSTDIYTKSADGQIAGIGVVKVEPKQVTVVCIEGAIDLASLAELAGHFGIPALGLPGQSSDQKQTKGVQ
ncbi:MAG TPA: DUF4252 domain-containing protein [Bryobacteraceae bacterium]|jgi:hypothetical protein